MFLSNNNVYKNNLQLEFDSITPPNYWWQKQQKRYNREQFQKHKLVEKGYDPNKTETEIMYELGYTKIYNSGNLKFIKIFE